MTVLSSGDALTPQGTIVSLGATEGPHDTANLTHFPLLPRLESMFNSTSNHGSYLLSLTRHESDQWAMRGSVDSDDEAAEESLGKRETALHYNMPDLEKQGIFEESDDMYRDMPPLETADYDVSVYLGIQSLMKCEPQCQWCIEPVPPNGVYVWDRHLTWMRSLFDSSVSMLVLHLLLRNFGISRPQLLLLFRIIFHVQYAHGVSSNLRTIPLYERVPIQN